MQTIHNLGLLKEKMLKYEIFDRNMFDKMIIIIFKENDKYYENQRLLSDIKEMEDRKGIFEEKDRIHPIVKKCISPLLLKEHRYIETYIEEDHYNSLKNNAGQRYYNIFNKFYKNADIFNSSFCKKRINVNFTHYQSIYKALLHLYENGSKHCMIDYQSEYLLIAFNDGCSREVCRLYKNKLLQCAPGSWWKKSTKWETFIRL